MPRFTLRDIPYSIRISGADGAVPITVANAANLNPTDSVCCSAWLYPVGVPKEFVVWDKSQNGATNSYFVSVGADGSPKWFSIIGGVVRNLATSAKSRRVIWNQWNLLEAGYDGSAIKLFLNGEELTETITGISGTMGVTTQDLRIGGYFTGATGLTFNGYIYRPILNTTLPTLAEHQNRYYNGIMSDAFIAGTLLDLRMTEGSGSTLADGSQYATNGTLGSLGTITTWNSSYAPTKARPLVSLDRSLSTVLRQDVGSVTIANASFIYTPTFVDPQTATNWIDGSATGSATDKRSGFAVFGLDNSVEAFFDEQESYDGSPSLYYATVGVNSRITLQTALTTSGAGLAQCSQIKPSTAYVGTFRLKTQYVSGDSSGVIASFVERTGTGTQAVVNSISAIKTTTDWTDYTVSFTSGSTSRLLTFRSVLTGNTGSADLLLECWLAKNIRLTAPSLVRDMVS